MFNDSLTKIYQVNISHNKFQMFTGAFWLPPFSSNLEQNAIPNAKGSQILKILRTTKCCQMLKVWKISPKFLNCLFLGQLT